MGNVFWYWFGLGIICGFFCAAVADAKNRSVAAWFLCGFLFNLIALITIADEDKQGILRQIKNLLERYEGAQ